MTEAQIAERQAADALPRFLAILAAIAVVSIGLILWTSFAGLPEMWRTFLVLLDSIAGGVVMTSFILKYALRRSVAR